MKRRHLAALAFLGCGIVFLETLLTRLFSTTLWYHFGFLAISLALLGISASGLQVFLRPALVADEGFDRRLARAAAGFALSAVLSVAFHLGVSFVGVSFGTPRFFALLAAHVAALAVPFYFGGLAVSMLMAKFHAGISRLYFVDLAASGLGATLVVLFLNRFSGPALVFLAGTLAAIAAALFGGRSRALPYGLLAAALATLFLANDSLGLLRVRYVKSVTSFQVQEREPPTAFEKWTPVARTTAFGPYIDPWARRPVYAIFNDSAAPTKAFGIAGGEEGLRQLTNEPGKAILEIARGGRVLIIGAGGGRDVWAALFAGAARVDAIELSPATAGLMKGELAAFTGNIYSHPRVAARVGEGRSFVEHATPGYRLIELSMVDSWVGNAAGSFLFNENHLYTEDAFRSYLRKLSPEGALVVTRYLPYDESLRVVSTMIGAMGKEGIREPEERIFVVRPTVNPRSATVFGFREAPSPEVVRAIERRVGESGGTVLWRPGLGRPTTTVLLEDRFIQMLLRPALSGLTREGFLAAYRYDVTPTTDDRPFFFFTQRSLFEPGTGMHPARRWALPFVAAVVLILALLSVATMVFPLLGRLERSEVRLPSTATLSYFALLGIGFMLVEVPMIQRFVLFLGNPTYAFVTVLTTLLVASGVGSAISGRLDSGRHLTAVLAAVFLAVLLVAPGLDPLLRALLGLSFPARLLVTVVAVSPLGLLMGMPFPLGIRLLSTISSRSIPWAWSINGVFSVLTTGLSLLVALGFGFRAALLLGGVSYGLAALASLRFGARTSGSSAVEATPVLQER